jgi:hypothetical protein
MTKNLLSTYTIRDTLGNYSRGFKTDGLYQEAAGQRLRLFAKELWRSKMPFPEKNSIKNGGNKACPLSVFISETTPTGVWRIKATHYHKAATENHLLKANL